MGCLWHPHTPVCLVRKLEWIQFCLSCTQKLLFYNPLKSFHDNRAKCHRPRVSDSVILDKGTITESFQRQRTIWILSNFLKMKENISDNGSAQFLSGQGLILSFKAFFFSVMAIVPMMLRLHTCLGSCQP